MKTQGLLFAFLDAVAFLLSTSFVFYVTSIIVPYLRYKPAVKGDGSGYEWHFLVPCLDEERVIEHTVHRLRTRFPAAHLWVIDDDSVDDTPVILARLAGRDTHVHVVSRHGPEARTGKGPALNDAWRAVSDWAAGRPHPERVVVGVVDADGDLDADCLDVLAGPRYFGDDGVSAVQVQVRVRNLTEGPLFGRVLVRLQDMEFTSVIAAIQMLRHSLGSVGMGGNGQFTRLATLDHIAAEYGEPWKKALIEDFELGLHILLIGGRNEYCHEASVWQQGPTSFTKLVRQRSRWGQGVMQCWRYFRPIMRSRDIPTSAAVEISYFLCLPWMQVLGDVVYLAAMASLVYVATSVPGGIGGWLSFAGGWQVIPVFLVFGVGPFFVWGPIYRRKVDPSLSRTRAVLLGLANWPYVLVHHCAAWWAFSRMLRSRHDWKKTDRVDERGLLPVWAAATPLVVVGRLRHRPRAARTAGELVLVPVADTDTATAAARVAASCAATLPGRLRPSPVPAGTAPVGPGVAPPRRTRARLHPRAPHPANPGHPGRPASGGSARVLEAVG